MLLKSVCLTLNKWNVSTGFYRRPPKWWDDAFEDIAIAMEEGEFLWQLSLNDID